MKISPLGDSAITVSFGETISPEINDKAIALCRYLSQNPFPGMIETVPAYSAAAVFYDVVAVRGAFSSFPTAFDAVCHVVSQTLESGTLNNNPESPRFVEIPVRFDAESGPDLSSAAIRSKLSETEFIERFVSKVYRVYMLGFLPGFPYMATVDDRIRQPRHDIPRLGIPKGSVGIAGLQTGIYPRESPGGWQIIGRTKMEMFVPERNEPATLRPGDEVQFVSES
jgi:inhibitor of KinA